MSLNHAQRTCFLDRSRKKPLPPESVKGLEALPHLLCGNPVRSFTLAGHHINIESPQTFASTQAETSKRSSNDPKNVSRKTNTANAMQNTNLAPKKKKQSPDDHRQPHSTNETRPPLLLSRCKHHQEPHQNSSKQVLPFQRVLHIARTHLTPCFLPLPPTPRERTVSSFAKAAREKCGPNFLHTAHQPCTLTCSAPSFFQLMRPRAVHLKGLLDP